ncbi:MAG: hypothetical protein J3R72DRAFT_455101 [Linnemannia gamsii]|nr:MAG: hypothetical protein J3R72DRAFT_455101 [Linnemannia gamsii]
MMFFSTKKSIATILVLLTLSCLQQLALAQTPTTPFVNTPGILAQAPPNGLTVRPDGNLPIAFNIGRRAISSVVVTVAKADGSGNTTILDHKTSAFRIILTAPLVSFKLPEGDYILNMVITPNTTSVIPVYTPPSSGSGSVPGTIPAPQQPAPTTTLPPSNLPGMYYWRTSIRISNNAPGGGTVGGSGGGGSGGGASNNAVVAGVAGMTGAWATFANMMTALTVLAFVNVVVL